MTKFCKRCGLEDGPNAAIHEHHLNGNHNDNLLENKIFLCANCHMTLHWKRWKLSDIGLPDIEIKRRYPSLTERIYRIPYPNKGELLDELKEIKERNKILENECENQRIEFDKRVRNLNRICLNLTYIVGHYNYDLENLIKV